MADDVRPLSKGNLRAGAVSRRFPGDWTGLGEGEQFLADSLPPLTAAPQPVRSHNAHFLAQLSGVVYLERGGD